MSRDEKKGPPANDGLMLWMWWCLVTDADGLDQRCAYRHLLGEGSFGLRLAVNILSRFVVLWPSCLAINSVFIPSSFAMRLAQVCRSP